MAMMKKGKTMREDALPLEVMDAYGEKALEQLLKVIQAAYTTELFLEIGREIS